MKPLFLVTLILIIVDLSYSQEVISTAGENYKNASGSVSWTIGEPVIETLESTNNYLTQGFHQPTMAIPTMGQWGLIICGLLLLSIGIVGIKNTKGNYPEKLFI